MPTALVTNACRYAGPHATTVLRENACGSTLAVVFVWKGP